MSLIKSKSYVFFPVFKKIAVVGYGGFARELLYNLKDYEIFVSDNTKHPQAKLLKNLDVDKYKVLLAIGDPKIKQKITSQLPLNTEYYSYIDKNAHVLNKNTITLGKGIIICAGSVLTTNVTIGDFTHINLNSTIGHDTIIKKYSTLTPGVNISGNCNIGEYNYFGTNTTVINKITTCDNVIIGSASNVVKNIFEPGVYVGNPVKKII